MYFIYVNFRKRKTDSLVLYMYMCIFIYMYIYIHTYTYMRAFCLTLKFYANALEVSHNMISMLPQHRSSQCSLQKKTSYRLNIKKFT